MLITLGWVVLSLMKPPSAHSEDMVLLPDGWFKPLYKSPDGVNKTAVPSFYIDRYLVTNSEFTAFAEQNPKWNKRQKKTLFHDEKYLSHLSTGGTDIDQQPVTHVSWFAARAYCKSEGKRLPTIAEWEYMAAASADKADGTGQRRLSFFGGRAATPEWSPRGDQIAFTHIAGDFNVAVMSPNGRNMRTLTNGWQDEAPTWAPNGRILQFFRTERNSGKTGLWQVDLTGENLRRLPTPVDASDPAWGPILP